MPELPEVETVRRQLADALDGAEVTKVITTGARTVRRHGGQDGLQVLDEVLRGRRLGRAERHGKYLLLPIVGDAESRRVLVHLRMSGQLRMAAADAPLAPHTHVRIALCDGRELRFVDPRTFGEVCIIGADEPIASRPLGPDALSVTSEEFRQLAVARRTRVKLWLTDQSVLAGVGNIYSDEALHRAGLHYARVVGALRPVQLDALYRATMDVLRAGIAAGGSSLADEQYVDLEGRSGGFQRAHRVYGREGHPCLTCAAAIRREVVAGRSTAFCPRCQPAPRRRRPVG